jgi:hypothetical protein
MDDGDGLCLSVAHGDGPCLAKLPDILLRDLLQWAEPLGVVGAAEHEPVVGSRALQHLLSHRRERSRGRRRLSGHDGGDQSRGDNSKRGYGKFVHRLSMKWVSNLREFMQGRAGIHESSEGVGKRRGLRAVCGKISADRRWSFRSEVSLTDAAPHHAPQASLPVGRQERGPPRRISCRSLQCSHPRHCHSAHDDRGSALCATVPSISERAEGRRKDRANLEGVHSDVQLPKLRGRSRFYGPDNFLPLSSFWTLPFASTTFITY